MRRVCFVINSRANYARIKTTIRESIARQDLEVFLVVGASGLLERFGNVSAIIEKDGFHISDSIYTVVEGDNPLSMVKTTGLSLISISDIFNRIKPDVVVTIADRYETIATAIASSYMNIPLAHTQGGEVTGSIDDSVRHAITKLAHLHFPSTKKAAEILQNIGEDPSTIHWVGCPSIDLVAEVPYESPENVMKRYSGVGANLDFSKPYILVSQHSDTLEHNLSSVQINRTIEAVKELKMQTVWLWPNVDSGSGAISKKLRMFRDVENPNLSRFYINFNPEDYVNIMRGSSCIVGNSSSGIREASFLGKPSVNIGDRQRGREKLLNVIDVPYDASKILDAIRKQIAMKIYPSDLTYGSGNAGKQMAEILAKGELRLNKKPLNLHDIS